MFADYISLIDVFSNVFQKGYSQLSLCDNAMKIIINFCVSHLDNISDKQIMDFHILIYSDCHLFWLFYALIC